MDNRVLYQDKKACRKALYQYVREQKSFCLIFNRKKEVNIFKTYYAKQVSTGEHLHASLGNFFKLFRFYSMYEGAVLDDHLPSNISYEEGENGEIVVFFDFKT